MYNEQLTMYRRINFYQFFVQTDDNQSQRLGATISRDEYLTQSAAKFSAEKRRVLTTNTSKLGAPHR